MFGIKEEEPEQEDEEHKEEKAKKEEEEKKEENGTNQEKEKSEKNKSIKIIETSINLSKSDTIKQKTVKKDKKSKSIGKIPEKPVIKISQIPSNEPKDEKNKEAQKEEEKEKVKDKEKAKENPTEDKKNSIFGNIFFPSSVNEKKEKDSKETKNVDNNQKTSLFNFDKDKKTSLFDNPMEKNSNNNILNYFANSPPLFSLDYNRSGSIFDSNIPSAFSNNNVNLFTKFGEENNIFNKDKNDDKKDLPKESLFDDNFQNEEDEEDKPKTKYEFEPLKAQDYSDYSKIYNTQINNLFIYNKEDKKYVSKGSGFLSIEKTKDEKNKEHSAVVVYRNQTGNKLIEGFINKKFNKFEIINKNFNFIVFFNLILMNNNKPELGSIKIQFRSEENAKQLKEAFESAKKFIEEK